MRTSWSPRSRATSRRRGQSNGRHRNRAQVSILPIIDLNVETNPPCPARVGVPATGGPQVSAKSGVFLHVKSDPGGEAPNLTVLESVRCLECGAVYAKPSG